MEEKETIQEKQEEKQEETDNLGEGKSQPTVEELQKQIEEARREIERKEGVLQQTKRELKEARRSGASKAEIEAIIKRLDFQEEWLAGALDDLATKVAGDYEEPKPTRKSYREELEERRQRAKPEAPKPDPDAQRFLAYCDAMDLHLDYDDIEACDPLVKEALSEGRDFREGLRYLKEKMKPKEVDIDKIVNEKLQFAVEQKLKELGLTSEGVGTPSGSSGRYFTRKQIENMSIEEYKEKKREIDEAIRHGRIRD